MGTKERHERDRHRIRQGILDAARELFIAEGYEHVSMRKIADRIEYSPAAIYSYFPRKDDIFFALAAEGFRILADGVSGAVAGIDDPLERLLRSHVQSDATTLGRRGIDGQRICRRHAL